MRERIENRVRLWLRGERALGQSYVVAPAVVAHVEHRPVQQPVPVAPRLAMTHAAPAPARPAAPPRIAPPPPTPEPTPMPAKLFAPATTEPFTSPILPRDEKIRLLAEMNDKEVKPCLRCVLGKTRTLTVFGEGDPDARLFFIGEGPGETEDLSGRPFVGRAGELLDKMIGGMGLRREQVFIANIVKCRPPGNREPAPDEVGTCSPYLVRQLEIIRPQVIVTLGRPATQFLLQNKIAMGRLRGIWQAWRGIKVMPTYHPAYVLRQYTRETREAVWSDLKKVMTELNLSAPKRAGDAAGV